MRKEGLLEWKKRDPIARLASAMITSGHLTESELQNNWTEYRHAVDAAWTQASADPYPPPSALLDRVYSQEAST